MRFLRSAYHRPLMLFKQSWPASKAIATKLDLSQPVEEEKTPYYSTDHFYPVRLSDVFNGRYQMVTKLGHGASSTVWLARDLARLRWLKERYVAIKVCATNDAAQRTGPESEVAILRRITNTDPRHQGWPFVRKLIDHFVISGTNGKHDCLTFEPLREPLWLYRRRWEDNVIDPGVVPILVRMILHALDYLHSSCNVIHTDLKPDNIMIRIEDPGLLDQDANDEYQNPLPQKHLKSGRIIYLSRNNYGRLRRVTGIIEITDFGLSVIGKGPHFGGTGADLYRAPEVILNSGYTSAVDVWSLGVMLWDLLEGKRLFEATLLGTDQDYDEHTHLACMTALLGPIPPDLVKGRRSSIFYDADGLKARPTIPTSFSFEDSITCMEGEEKAVFIKFVKRMIAWRPEDRSTAKELLDDPWLQVEGLP